MNGQYRNHIGIGMPVAIVKKEHQRSGILTTGKVMRILTRKDFHPRGIKVELQSGEIGRAKKIL